MEPEAQSAAVIAAILGPLAGVGVAWILQRRAERKRVEARHEFAVLTCGRALHQVLQADQLPASVSPGWGGANVVDRKRERQESARLTLAEVQGAFLETAKELGGDTWTTALRLWGEMSLLAGKYPDQGDTTEKVDPVLTSFYQAYPSFRDHIARAINAQEAMAQRMTTAKALREGGQGSDDDDES